MINSRDYREFCDNLKEELEHLIAEEGGSISADIVHKNNKDLEGWAFQFPDSPLHPMVYPERLFEQRQDGLSISEIAEMVYLSTREATRSMKDPSADITRENAADAVRLCVCDLENNKDWLKEKKIPYLEIADGRIAAYPRWFMQSASDKGIGSFVVDQNISGSLRMTKSEILKLASENIRSSSLILTPLNEKLGFPDPTGNSPLCVELDHPTHGAAVITDKEKLNEIYDRIGPYYLIPSSIHEVLVLPKDTADPDALNAMIRDVNEQCVAKEEQLCDRAFAYDGRSLHVAGVSKSEDFQQQELMELLGASNQEVRHAAI